MNVLLLQLDGKMPNLALMRLAAHHRQQGDSIVFHQLQRNDGVGAIALGGLFDQWDAVYVSLIFTRSQPLARWVQGVFPSAWIGGTGWNFRTLEDCGLPDAEGPLDYTLYPAFKHSLGFSQRGCRLDCSKFCVVPQKEPELRDVATIREIWRGEPHPRNLILLDNDFFGSPTWKEKIAEIREGRFKVSLSQGINARMISDEAAAALASIRYYNDEFDRRCIHTAWDNIGDEKPLFRGLRALVKYGVRPDNITVYMLTGLDSDVPTEKDFERHRKLREFGCRPFPMPFRRGKKGEPGYELVRFQTWVVRRVDLMATWEEFRRAGFRQEALVNR